jgi:hypothetical protein
MKRVWIGTLICISVFCTRAEQPQGFQGAKWKQSPAEVRQNARIPSWTQSGRGKDFPPELEITVFTARMRIAGYPASVDYYFQDNKFFQATVRFDFSHLANFDFNYNVYRSVDEYYRAIHDQTVTFVHDIYDLLEKKYGKRKPLFKGLDPRFIFERTDRYLQQERWNLRYHPYEYYERIVTAAYARWDYPETRAIFSVNISAIDKRFDYILSLVSLDCAEIIESEKDSLRAEGL